MIFCRCRFFADRLPTSFGAFVSGPAVRPASGAVRPPLPVCGTGIALSAEFGRSGDDRCPDGGRTFRQRTPEVLRLSESSSPASVSAEEAVAAPSVFSAARLPRRWPFGEKRVAVRTSMENNPYLCPAFSLHHDPIEGDDRRAALAADFQFYAAPPAGQPSATDLFAGRRRNRRKVSGYRRAGFGRGEHLRRVPHSGLLQRLLRRFRHPRWPNVSEPGTTARCGATSSPPCGWRASCR